MVAALYRRYRPESFAEMVGQQQVTEPLMTALRTGRINHAYLFSGPRGCGKTSSARILARCLNCAKGPTDTPCGECESCVELGRDGGGSLDVFEIDAASHGGVDDARDLRERAMMAPSRDRFKIFIIDEAHMVTGAGFNALLKVVEEPPEHVLFIFATTEPEKVIGTIRSRTHHFPFRLIPPAAMLRLIEDITEAEGMHAEAGVLPLVVRAGGGSARDTESLLDQIMAGTEGDTMRYEMAVQLLGFTSDDLLDGTINALADHNASAAYAEIDSVIQSGQDPRRFVEDLLERIRDLIVAKATGEGASSVLRGVGDAEIQRLRDAAGRFTPQQLSAIGDAVNRTLTEMSGVTSPRVQLELMVARILVGMRAAFADAPGIDAADGAADAGQARGAQGSTVSGGAAASGSESASTANARVQTSDTRAPVPAAPTAGARPTAAEDASTAKPAEVKNHREAATASWSTTRKPAATNDTAPVNADQASSEAGPGAAGAAPQPAAKPGAAGAAPQTSAEASSTREAAADAPAAEMPSPAAEGERAAKRSDSSAAGTTPPSFAQIRDAWDEVLQAVQEIGGRSAWLVVSNVRPLELVGSTLRVELPSREVSEQLRARTGDKPAAGTVLKQSLTKVIGTEFAIQPRVRLDHDRPAPGSPAPADEGDRHRGSAAPAETPQKRGPKAPQPWTVRSIPSGPADDGPGSAWDEHATPAPDASADASAAQQPEAASAPAPEREAPEVIAAKEAAARERATEPEHLPEMTLRAAPEEAATVRNPIEPEAPLVVEPEPSAFAHPAQATGRYGESVVREILGARFIDEVPNETTALDRELRSLADEAGPAADEAPDDFEAPPEDR